MITDAEVERFIKDLGYSAHFLTEVHDFSPTDLRTDVRSALERFVERHP